MRMVVCGSCGKRYDFDKHDFCPGCGGFNPPAKRGEVSKPASAKRKVGKKRRRISGRTRTLLVVAAVVLLFAGLDFVTRIPRVGPIQDVTSFTFKYSDTKDWESAICYRLWQESGRSYRAVIYPDGWQNEETALEFTVDEQFRQRLEALLVENHVRWWRGPYVSILHGNSGLLGKSQYICDLSYSQADGTRKFTTAYMTKPINYERVKDGVIELFSELLE